MIHYFEYCTLRPTSSSLDNAAINWAMKTSYRAERVGNIDVKEEKYGRYSCSTWIIGSIARRWLSMNLGLSCAPESQYCERCCNTGEKYMPEQVLEELGSGLHCKRQSGDDCYWIPCTSNLECYSLRSIHSKEYNGRKRGPNYFVTKSKMRIILDGHDEKPGVEWLDLVSNPSREANWLRVLRLSVMLNVRIRSALQYLVIGLIQAEGMALYRRRTHVLIASGPMEQLWLGGDLTTLLQTRPQDY